MPILLSTPVSTALYGELNALLASAFCLTRCPLRQASWVPRLISPAYLYGHSMYQRQDAFHVLFVFSVLAFNVCAQLAFELHRGKAKSKTLSSRSVMRFML